MERVYSCRSNYSPAGTACVPPRHNCSTHTKQNLACGLRKNGPVLSACHPSLGIHTFAICKKGAPSNLEQRTSEDGLEILFKPGASAYIYSTISTTPILPPSMPALLHLLTAACFSRLCAAAAANTTTYNSSALDAARTICAGPWDTAYLNNGPMLMQKADCISAFMSDFTSTYAVYQSQGRVDFYDERSASAAAPRLRGVGGDDNAIFRLPWKVRHGMCSTSIFLLLHLFPATACICVLPRSLPVPESTLHY